MKLSVSTPRNKFPGVAFRLCSVVVLFSIALFGQSGKKSPKPLRNSRQALVVITPDWEAVDGTLQRFERSGVGSPWEPVGAAVPVVIGKNGMAWDASLSRQPAGSPVKREGDLKSPAGVFRLGKAFGRSRDELAGLRIPYRLLGDDLECVDDPHSKYYNQLVTRKEIAQPDWTSSEKMWQERLYKRGVVVEYNTPARAGAGSCIFLHIWNGPHRGTAGCTAMGEPNLVPIMNWLDPSRNPVLVQLPKSEYEQLKPTWHLP